MRYYIVAFLLYEILFGAYFYSLYFDNKQYYHNRVIELTENSFESAVHAYEMSCDNFYASQSDAIARLVHEANGAEVSKRDKIRKELLEGFMSFFIYRKLNSFNGFHIFDKDGKSLLRFHQPLHYDDDIIKKRYSIQRLEKKHLYQRGFELGVFQESYRFQYPLFYDGEFVGSYEYSVDSQAIINEMQNFYGDYCQLLFKAGLFEKVVLKDVIDKYYKKVQTDSETFYLNKHTYRKNIDKNRFKCIKMLKDLQYAVKSKSSFVVDYEYAGEYRSIVVLPVKDIEKKIFAYMLVHLDKSPVGSFKNILFVELLFVTLFGLMLYIYIFRENQNKKYIKELINLQQDLIMVGDGINIEDTNVAFLDFFGYKTLKEFKKDYRCICELFIKDRGCLQNINNGLNWIRYIEQNPKIEHKVKFLNIAKEERIFRVEMEKIHDTHRFFVLFRDITEELNIKKELEKRANFDTLTRIFNRSRFEFFLNKEIEKASRYKTMFSLIMFDIDHFKSINDTYGHGRGDSVLVELSSLVLLHTRDVDIFARWGGEEFMIISQTNILQTEMFSQKLRMVVEKHHFEGIGSLTCSFGVTQYRDGDTIESIVGRCDKMLYKAKESGRNCVVSSK